MKSLVSLHLGRRDFYEWNRNRGGMHEEELPMHEEELRHQIRVTKLHMILHIVLFSYLTYI